MTEKILENFTIIIPTVGRPILKECLTSLITGSCLPSRIIIIDQGNNPSVAYWIQEVIKTAGIDILHIRSEGRSPASARNEGMAHVQTSFVATIDDDCLAEKDWLEKMDANLRKHPGLIVTGRVEAGAGGIPQTITSSKTPFLLKKLTIRNLSPLATGNMGVSVDQVLKIGEFDENLYTAEDTDWAYRAMQTGIPILYAPDVVVYHHHWRDRSQTKTNYQAYALGLGAFFGKHLRHWDLSMILRTLLALYRGTKSILLGWKNRDENLILIGKARLTKLIPGVIDGFRGIGFKQKR